MLVPPSQGKAPGGRRQITSGRFDATLAEARYQVVDALRCLVASATLTQLEAALSARGPLLERALESTKELVDGTPPTLAAWRRYQGVVWTYLNPISLTPAQRRRVLVPSGLYGLLASDDQIVDYRLKMNARLNSMPSLALFWRPKVTEALLEATRSVTIVNFLPQEHAASIDMALLQAQRTVIDVRFVAADKSRAIGHDAKAVKGELARAVVREGVSAFLTRERLGWRVERHDHDVAVIAPATRSLNPEP
ncbi:MAG: peroxide stress protein YaaA [Acidimicrobiales bacterium]